VSLLIPCYGFLGSDDMKRYCKIIYYLIFYIGLTVSAVFSIPDPPQWKIFSLGVIISAIGAILIRTNINQSNTVEGSSSIKKLGENIKRIDDTIKGLLKLIEKYTIEETKYKIEKIQHCAFEFSENIYMLKTGYGLASSSEIFIAFASGERYLNRAWSAVVDNNKDEMKNSLEFSSEKFSETRLLFNKLI